MALTRKTLKAMGIEEDKIDLIIEAHTESTDALKQQRDEYKAKAEAKATASTEPKPKDHEPSDGYKAKYDAEKKAFEDYKANIAAEKAEADKRAKYRELIVKAGVDSKRVDSVLKVSDLSEIKVKDGAIEGADDLVKSIKEDWADFIPTTQKVGANAPNPPKNDGGVKKLEDITKMQDPVARQDALAKYIEAQNEGE
ncbi:hypothetical protein [uncultured Senegalimassilia sp.]|uniref:phage scaffolding protein n=1 Tax=uncultured Senegalimassilia sp. TaxID=1714350 RepID=UPI0025CBB439|nr:hypothetical protein [uncultured Senegalimassilia sp.]